MVIEINIMTNVVAENKITTFAIENGADVVGFSCLGDIWHEISTVWPVADITTRNAVTVGIALNNEIVDQLLSPHADTYDRYISDCYVAVNNKLNELTADMARYIAGMGYKSHAVPASDRHGTSGLLGTFSHKIAGRRAGMGWIGRNCMLITPQYGPRIRWGTVLTDAPFSSVEIMDNKCGDCRACVDICPVQAYTGREFIESEPLSARYDTAKCRDYQAESRICSKCLAVCPWGSKG